MSDSKTSADQNLLYVRAEFEAAAKKLRIDDTRRDMNHGYYLAAHTEYAFIGWCLAKGINHRDVP